jgi:hypothetical protein
MARGRVGSAAAQSSLDGFQHASQVSINIAIPEAKSAKSRSEERSVAPQVAPTVRVDIKLTTVDLDNQSVLHANKIDNDVLARRLTAVMITPLTP